MASEAAAADAAQSEPVAGQPAAVQAVPQPSTVQSGAEAARGSRRVAVGIVISDKRQKTITVEVKHLVKHPRYGKYMYRSTLLHAHDEKNEAKKGDRVELVETRPISKQKRWRLVRVVERAAVLGQLEIKEVEEVAPRKAEHPAPPVEPQPAAAGSPSAAPAQETPQV